MSAHMNRGVEETHRLYSLTPREKRAYRILELFLLALRYLGHKRGKGVVLRLYQVEEMFVLFAELYGFGDELLKRDKQGNCPAVMMKYGRRAYLAHKQTVYNFIPVSDLEQRLGEHAERERVLEFASQALVLVESCG